MKTIPEYIEKIMDISADFHSGMIDSIKYHNQLNKVLTNALTQQREEIVEMIEGMRKVLEPYKDMKFTDIKHPTISGGEKMSYNQALDTIINNLK